jgi:hypothetical protein
MMLQNLTESRQTCDAVIKEIRKGLPSRCSKDQALRRCQLSG